MEAHLNEFLYIAYFVLIGIVAALGPILLSLLVHPRKRTKRLETSYECGMDPFGKASNIRFDIAYYVYALIFLAFAVDVLYLFPVAVAFHKVTAVRGVVELFVFVGILSLAIVYAWVKGVFTWPKKRKII